MSNLFKNIFIPTIALFIICLVVTVVLAITNDVTKDKIVEMEDKSQTDALSEVLPSAVDFVEKDSDTETAHYVALNAAGETMGYIFTTSSKGYGGDVSVMTAIAPDGEIISVKVLSVADETPGLGQNAQNNNWANTQFSGKSDNVDINDIDALSGATITSKAVTTAVDEALQLYSQIGGEN